MIYKYRWILLIIFIAGLFILLLPDKGQPVIQLNQEHGPSIPDIVGLLLMLGSWFVSIIFIAKKRADLTRRFGNSILVIMIVLYLVSIGGIIAGLNSSIEWIIWLSVATATIINSAFIISAFKVASN